MEAQVSCLSLALGLPRHIHSGPCDFSVSPSPFCLDFGTLDFGTSDSGLTILKILIVI